jgi:hypothetical protein
MDATITYDEVATLVGVNIPTLEPCPNFERIWMLCRHFEHALQCLPCPQSVQHGWKGMVMARELYALLTTQPFCLPTNPGATAIYVRNQMPGQPVNNASLRRMEQASIDSLFNQRRAYFLLMQNIKQACFTALDSSVDDAFKVSNNPTVQGWHTGMRVINIFDQLSMTYGQPTPSALEANNHIFRSPMSAADPPKVLFRCIEECAETAFLGKNSHTDKQLIMNMIRHFLTTRLYIRAFKDWDQLAMGAKLRIEVRRIIQEAFQRRLNALAPTLGHQGYTPALPFQQNAFNALAANNSDDDTAERGTTHMAALTYQSHLTAATAANSSLQALAQQQEQLHQTQHQIIEQLAALSINQRDAGQGIGCHGHSPPHPPAPFSPNQFGRNNFGSRGRQGRGRGSGRDRGPPAFNAGRAPPLMSITTGRAPAFWGLHPTTGGGNYTPLPQAQALYSNITKRLHHRTGKGWY